MLGTLVNTGAVIVGSLLGLLLKKGLSERISDTLMKGLGLCTLYIGITGALKGDNTLVLIVSLVAGALIGEGLDLEGRLSKLGRWVERRFQKPAGPDGSAKKAAGGTQAAVDAPAGRPGGRVSVAEGFVTASLLFCVGAMSIVGSLQSGLTGNHEMLYMKSCLDFVAAIIFASQLGFGVLFAALFVLVYQGAITLLAQWVSPFLTDPVIAMMTCVGSVIIIGLALNMIGITKLKVMNYVPAIFLVPLFLWLYGLAFG